MWPEAGHLALIMAAWVAVLQSVLPLWGSLSARRAGWQALARPLAVLQLVLIVLAFGALWHAFYVHDFSVKYVAHHSNTLLPTPYRLSAIWAGHEGSLLLWVLMLALWSVAVATFSKRLPQALVAQVLGVMGAVSVGFLAFILALSNPFARQFPAPAEGRDLTPLLQDPGLVIHPPMLYMGYVGLSVAFAFAMAALLSGRLDAAWARWARPWTVAAWGFLTLGIALGSWWAYYELGWGGWWFWDPVENASLMPWLVATALIHSLMVTDKRGQFKAWTVLLAIGAFSLSLLGTFLVRSGVLTSVHAFATDPGRGVFILLFLLVVVGVSLALFAWRAPQWANASQPVAGSRESFLLLNSVLLVVAMAAVLLGTLYPLIIDALNLGKLSVGPPYFDRVFVPLMVPLLLAMVPGTVPSLEYYKALFARCGRVMQAIQALPVPVIARVHGIATAAGCQLVASCDLAIAASSARFAVSGINVGLFCATPAVALSRNVSSKRAFDMLVTGRFIDAGTAAGFGLINDAVPDDELDAAVARKAADIVGKSPAAIRHGKAMFYRQRQMALGDAYDYAGDVMEDQ
eukprot:gene25028-31437_t